MKKVAIVIPIYKNILCQEEIISLNRINTILGEFPIFYVAPYGIKDEIYKQIMPKAKIVYFQSSFFNGFSGYNRLMTSIEFYSAFLEYMEILICQTDVFVVSNQLMKYVSLDYDYIGAPCAKHKPWEKRLYVGNGGFSLRNVRATSKAINNGMKNNLIEGKNEDTFFSDYGENNPKEYRIAPIDIAAQFAFDQPLGEISYYINQKKMPMAIHGWFNYDTTFTNKILSEYMPQDYSWQKKVTYKECLEKLDRFLRNNKRIIFYGAGDIGGIFYDYCQHKKINVEGFVVSDDQEIKKDREKQIWHLSECKILSSASVLITIFQRYRAKGEYVDKLTENGVDEIMELDETTIFAVEDYLLKNTINNDGI